MVNAQHTRHDRRVNCAFESCANFHSERVKLADAKHVSCFCAPKEWVLVEHFERSQNVNTLSRSRATALLRRITFVSLVTQEWPLYPGIRDGNVIPEPCSTWTEHSANVAL